MGSYGGPAGSSSSGGGSGGGAGRYADTAKRFAGRSLLAVGTACAKSVSAVAKGVSALTASTSDKEGVRYLKFALVEWSAGIGTGAGVPGSAACCGGTQHAPLHRLPALLVGLETGFQVWRLDGENPAELLSRRDGPVKLLEAVPEPRTGEEGPLQDELASDRPLLAVVPAPERPSPLPGPGAHLGASNGGSSVQHQHPHSLQLYSLRSHGYVRSLSFGGEVLGVAASSRLLVVALRGQLQAFDACSLQHTFSCLTYTPPAALLLPAGGSGGGSGSQRRYHHHHQQQQQFVTAGLTSSSDEGPHHHWQQQQGAGACAPAAAPPPLAPFALGPRWLAYAADTPVPQASGQAVAQRLPLGRQDSSHSAAGASAAAAGLEPEGSGSVVGGIALGSSPSGRANGLTTAAVADAARAAAAKGGQQIRAGLTAVGSASFKYLSQQYASWRQGSQQPQQRDLDALEADAAVAGTVVVRDTATRLVVAHFRAHTSPLAALQFSPGGTLLATASVAGHSINLFRIVPPAAAAWAAGAADSLAAGGAGGGGGGGSGHAVWLYRLYRGVTPAAICGISFAPDAAWVAVSSGRGTTHLFRTPAAAPGARQAEPQQQPSLAAVAASGAAAAAADTAVVGRPPKLAAVGRARKPGLLGGGGAAGAATLAARNLYTGQAADAAPIAAAFLAAVPSTRGSTAGTAAAEGGSDASSLYVVTQDGLLTRHLLRVPAAEGAGAFSAAAGPGPGPGPSAASSASQLERQESGAAGGAAGAAAAASANAVLEEADRWDVARHVSWPEREELLPGLALGLGPAPPALAAGAAGAAGVAASSGAAGSAAADAAQQQVWVAQAEAGALAASAPAPAPGGSGPGPGPAPLPLWSDPQFRFFELQVAALQRQRSATAAATGGYGSGSGSDGAEGPPCAAAASSLDGGDWLEHLPARPIQQ